MINNTKKVLNLSSIDNNDGHDSYFFSTNELSVYRKTNHKVKTPVHTIMKNKQSKMFEEQLVEAYEVKERLAKYKIAVPMKRLMNSLITPVERERHLDLPEPGFGILENPFMEKEKEKRKKRR